MSRMAPLLIRADSSVSMGTGHVMRCLALAQGWTARGGDVTFLGRYESPALPAHLEAAGMRVRRVREEGDPRAAADVLRELAGGGQKPWMVLDGYQFDAEYQRAIRESGWPLLVVDDGGELPWYHASVILNQNLEAESRRYPCGPETRLLLGTRFALLRAEFRSRARRRRRVRRTGARVLVSLGGADAENGTLKVLQALAQVRLDGLEVCVVAGPANPHRDALREAIGGFRLLETVEDMPSLMEWADAAVVAGGTTCWEIAYLGLPSLVMILAENQRPVAESLARCGAARSMGWHHQVSAAALARALEELLADEEARRAMSRTGRSLVDGRGVDRVVRELSALESA